MQYRACNKHSIVLINAAEDAVELGVHGCGQIFALL